MKEIIWVLAYATENRDTLKGFLKDPEFLFSNQEAAHQKKQEAFDTLYQRKLVSTVDQVMVVPWNELDAEIQ